MIIIGYYTTGTRYEALAEKMKASADVLGLPCTIKGYQNRGSWVANCAIKPEFIREMLDVTEDNLLYVDADAVIRKIPILCYTITEDMAAYYKSEPELLSGTIFIRNNTVMKTLVDEWCAYQHKHPGEWDQKTLLATVNKLKPSLYRLPQSYTKIFDAKDATGEEAVIEHFQESRKQYTLPPENRIVKNIRLRTASDGSIFISRANPIMEKFLDNKYIRVPNELRWLPHSRKTSKLDSIRKYIKGKDCYIIGKGPSLDSITTLNPDWPIFCLNDSIHHIETLNLPNRTFVTQQDNSLEDKCKPLRAMLLASYAVRNWYADHDRKIIFHMEELGLVSCLSIIVVIRMLQKYDAKHLHLIAFDACMDRSTDYAACIGYASTQGGSPDRFLAHRQDILNEAKIPLTFEEAT